MRPSYEKSFPHTIFFSQIIWSVQEYVVYPIQVTAWMLKPVLGSSHPQPYSGYKPYKCQ